MQKIAGIVCNPHIGEITYGLERLALIIQNTKNFYAKPAWTCEIPEQNARHRQSRRRSLPPVSSWNVRNGSTNVWKTLSVQSVHNLPRKNNQNASSGLRLSESQADAKSEVPKNTEIAPKNRPLLRALQSRRKWAWAKKTFDRPLRALQRRTKRKLLVGKRVSSQK